MTGTRTAAAASSTQHVTMSTAVAMALGLGGSSSSVGPLFSPGFAPRSAYAPTAPAPVRAISFPVLVVELGFFLTTY